MVEQTRGGVMGIDQYHEPPDGLPARTLFRLGIGRLRGEGL
jgi:hypothetical protein